MRRTVQKEEILRMKNYKILISDSTVLFQWRLHSGSNKNKSSRNIDTLKIDEKLPFCKLLKISRNFWQDRAIHVSIFPK